MKTFASMRFAAALALALFSPSLLAQSYPAKPVRMVIGLPPGGGSDPMARVLAQRLTVMWGQPVVVENRPGANTIIATEIVAKAPGDGLTLLFAFDHSFTLNPHMYAKLPYDPIKDFAPITQLLTFAVPLVAHPSLRANSVQELVALAKAEPGKLSYGSIGIGSHMHIVSELLNAKAGINIAHVPYKGIPQMTAALLGGEIQLTWFGIFTTRPLVAQKRVNALAYSGTKRSPFMPEVPTFAELGFPGVDIAVWYGIAAPSGTARPIVDKIHADISKILSDPEFRDKEILSRAYDPSGLGPDEFSALIRRELAVRAEVVRISGAKVE
ncbi:MAG: tripartite tricarboxylate transporter substrate binding protein [Burkholderiales bacterium]